MSMSTERRRLITGAATCGLTAVLLHTAALQQPWIPYEVLSRDLFQVTAAAAYTALLSNLGVALWLAAGAVALFAAAALKHRPWEARPLLWAGLLSLWLCLDDFLMLHEAMGRRLGGSTSLLIVLEGIAGIVWLIRCRRWLVRTEWRLLVMAGAAWSVSLAFDFIHDELPARITAGVPEVLMYFAEDMPKLIGITVWAWFVASEALRAVRLQLPDFRK